MTEYENLIVEQDGAVRTVTLNRPKVLNALNAALLDELELAMAAAATDATVGGVILTGAGPKSFVAGADILELKELGPQAARDTARRGQELFTRIERLGKPVIAAVNGFALGGGLELACCCTFRTASTNALLGLPEVKLGLIPGYGGTQRLPRLVGIGRAAELVLTGEPIKADEAYRIGLVNHVFEPDALLAQTREILEKILARAPVAVAYAQEALWRGLDGSLADGLHHEASLFGILASTEDMAEGTTAFVEKRAPTFRGR